MRNADLRQMVYISFYIHILASFILYMCRVTSNSQLRSLIFILHSYTPKWILLSQSFSFINFIFLPSAAVVTFSYSCRPFLYTPILHPVLIYKYIFYLLKYIFLQMKLINYFFEKQLILFLHDNIILTSYVNKNI